jgi:glycosyltransferase involved in cell wall biosynthesis
MNFSQKYNLGILVTHPIQYYVPFYKALATEPEIDLTVFYCYNQTPEGQAKAGFGISFDWDIPLLDGYNYQFLKNQSKNPNVFDFWGCDTPEIMKIIHERKFDAFLVQGWYVKSYWQAMLACWQTSTPVLIRGDSQLVTQRSWLKKILKSYFYRWFIPKFAGYLAVGQRSKEYYLHYGADKDKVFFVPHAVNNTFFADCRATLESQRQSIRQHWGIPESALVFLFVGKLIPKKRPEDFQQAIYLATKNSCEIFGLVVGDGELRLQLEVEANHKNIPIKFVGFLNQTEISKAYTISDVLVLPSDGRETWGLVVNEAMASGLPAVVSDQVGCATDLVIPGETGEVFPCGDIETLVSILTRMAANKKSLQKMADNAFELVNSYSISKATKETIQAIKFTSKKSN